MALTAARVTHPGTLEGFAGQQLPAGAWLPGGPAPAAGDAWAHARDGLPVLAGHSDCGRLWPVGQTPGQ